MKEQTLVLSEVEGLTNQPQNLYSKVGEIFMAEPGQSENPTNRETSYEHASPSSAETGMGIGPPSNQENEESPQPGGAGAGSAGGRPPAPPGGMEGGQMGNGEEDRPQDPFREVVDPNLDSYKSQARNIIDRVNIRAGVGVNTAQYENFYRSIMNLTPPSNYTQDQRSQFYNQKQLLLSSLARELRDLFTPIRDETPERVDKRTRLIYAIEHDDYDEIDKIIDSENPNSQNSFFPFLVEDVVERFGNEAHKDKSYMVDYLLEYAIERILRRADVSPKDAYPQFGFYEGINLDSVVATARIYDASLGRRETKGMFRYLSALRFRRQIMHELFRAMKNRQDYATYITQHLRKEGLAFVEKEIVGVSEVQILYEKVLGSRLSFRKGWLTSFDMEAAEADVDTLLNEYNSKDAIKKDIKDAEGNLIRDVQGKVVSRALRPWEVSRALRAGTSLNAATQRGIVYTILGDIPFNDIDTLLDSVDSEFLARILAPMKLITHRFLGIDTNLRKIFIEELLKKTKELAEADDHKRFGYGEKDKDGNRKGLYGKREDSWAILDTGVTDPKSNGWRGRKIFLKQKDYQTETLGGETLSIGDYMDRVKREVRDRIEEMLKNKYPRKKPREIDSIIETQYGGQIEKQFNEKIAVVLGKQRLFLGAMLQMKGGDLSLESKQMIWEKVAELLPSRIAAFFPEETLEIVQRVYGGSKEQARATWDRLKTKLFLAESKRVTDDAANIKGKKWEEIGDGVLKNLSDYYRDAGIGEPTMGLGEQDPEIRVIEGLTDFVKKKARDTDRGGKIAMELARIKFPYTPFLDDVPKTDWENIGDASYDRILVQDQSDFQEGYNAIIGLIGKPVINPEDVVKIFVTVKGKIEGPLGLKGKGGAQGVMQKYINAYLSMTAANGLAKLFDPLMKIGRIPRSKVEMGNLKANMAQNELFQGRILDGLAQQDVISDDPTEVDKDGKTQYRRMQEENKADLKNKFYFWARMLVAILGLELVLELFKSFLPPDFAKSFG